MTTYDDMTHVELAEHIHALASEVNERMETALSECLAMGRQNAVLVAENERLRAALGKYADYTNWTTMRDRYSRPVDIWDGGGRGWAHAEDALK